MNRKILSRMGYYKDQEGIINRYLREKENWDSHLSQTKKYILSAAQTRLKSKVVVLGSGWLLDIPFAELSALFLKVVLVDVKHPRQIIRKISGFTNIKLIETDISGLSEKVYRIISSKKKKDMDELDTLIPEFEPDFYNEILDADFVVSANLLNQLDILLCDYLVKKGWCNLSELSGFRKHVQASHLNLLPKGKSVLITDYEEINLNEAKQVVNRKSLIYLNLPHTSSEKWTWNFDLHKTYHHKLFTHFKVLAVEL